MNNLPPVASENLLTLPRGPTSRLYVQLDTWDDGKRTVKIATARPSVKGDICRSVTIYPDELRGIAIALAAAHKQMGLPV